METYEEYLLSEGAWGHGPLDNDAASDWKAEIGELILKEIKHKLRSSSDANYKYYAIGMWEFIRDRLKTQYSFFDDTEIQEMNLLCRKTADYLTKHPDKLIHRYNNPEKVQAYLNRWL